jgi:hypothetical protein
MVVTVPASLVVQRKQEQVGFQGIQDALAVTAIRYSVTQRCRQVFGSAWFAARNARVSGQALEELLRPDNP